MARVGTSYQRIVCEAAAGGSCDAASLAACIIFCRGAADDEFKSRTISVVQKGSPAWVKRTCSKSPFSR